MKIYTKRGDSGETSLFGSDAISKSSLRVNSYGDIDEANSVIGLIVLHIGDNDNELKEKILSVQNRLFDLGSELATVKEEFINKLPRIIQNTDISTLEKEIDDWQTELNPLKNFILPGGNPSATYCHLARAVVRRAERSIVQLSQQEAVRSEILIFVNRLSDWLFVLSRFINKRAGIQDREWQK